jgi:hypothetical protein
VRRTLRSGLQARAAPPSRLQEVQRDMADILARSSTDELQQEVERRVKLAKGILDEAEDAVVTAAMRQSPETAILSERGVETIVAQARGAIDAEQEAHAIKRAAARGQAAFDAQCEAPKGLVLGSKNHGALQFNLLVATKVASGVERERILNNNRAALDAARERAMVETETEATRTFMGQAWALLTDRQQKELADALAGTMLRQLRGGATEATIKTALRELVDAQVSEQLAAREDEIVARVRKEVDARWEAEVENVVQQRVRAALDAVRAKL